MQHGGFPARSEGSSAVSLAAHARFAPVVFEIPGASFGEGIGPSRPLDPGMGVAVGRRTVFRPEDQEDFGRVADRVAEGNTSLVETDRVECAHLRNAIACGAILTSGRHLQHGDAEQSSRPMEVFTNCSTAAASFSKFYLLLNGSGVGRSYDDAMMLVDWEYAPELHLHLSPYHVDHALQNRAFFAHEFGLKDDEVDSFLKNSLLPRLSEAPHGAIVHRVADSREGWAKAFEIYEAMTYRRDTDVALVLDFSDVRPAGSPIAGMQGRPASGPLSLMRAFLNVRIHVVDYSRDERLPRWQQALTVDHYLSVEVQVGGARRAARMATKWWKDPDVLSFIRIKERGGLWTANHSIMVDGEFWTAVETGDPRARDIFEEATRCAHRTGEPGFINADLLDDHRTGFSSIARDTLPGSSRYELTEAKYLMTKLHAAARKVHYPTITNPCFAADTLIATKQGAFRIKDLVGKTVDIWTGDAWQTVDNFRVTGKNQRMLKFIMQDGSSLRVTESHTMVLESNACVCAKDICPGDILRTSDVVYEGTMHCNSAYIKGFLLGDGTSHSGSPILSVYEPKYSCLDRLIASLKETSVDIHVRSDAIDIPGFVDNDTPRQIRKRMHGLTSRKSLLPWTTEYRNAIPDFVYQWRMEDKAEFIAGLFDADGTAVDSPHGFGYQLGSVNRSFLLDVQILLKTMGVRSKVSLCKPESRKLLPGGEYDCQAFWRLHMGQRDSVTLADRVRFTRLASFSDRVLAYNTKKRSGKVETIEYDGVDEEVYCCTVEGSHTLTTAGGIVTGNCGEIGLHLTGGYCVLASVAPFLAKPEPWFKGNVYDEVEWDSRVVAAVRLAVRFLVRVNTMEAFYGEETKRSNRIGIGLTGIHSWAWVRYGLTFRDLLDEERSKEFWETVRHLSQWAKFEANRYSDELRLNRPATVTTMKPDGSIAKLFALEEGAHLPARSYYLRWVQFKGIKVDGVWGVGSDPLLEEYESRGYPMKELKTFPGMTAVGFPTAPLLTRLGMGDALVTASEATPAEHYQWLRLLEKYWIGEHQGNQVSYTLKVYTDRVDLASFRSLVLDNQPTVRCCAILPTLPDDQLPYEYLPEEAISEKRFQEIVTAIDMQSAAEEAVDMEHLRCEAGVCPL
jgi:ribonucleotide reductase alpha subunit